MTSAIQGPAGLPNVGLLPLANKAVVPQNTPVPAAPTTEQPLDVLTEAQFRHKYDTGKDSLFAALGAGAPDGSVSVKEIMASAGLGGLVNDLARMKPAHRRAAMNLLDREAQKALDEELGKRDPSDPARMSLKPEANPELVGPPAPAPKQEGAPAAELKPDPKARKSDAKNLAEVEAGKGVLRPPARGDAVKQVQERLIAEGFLAPTAPSGRSNADGIFGSTTSNAVRDFKKARVQGSSEDGVVDQATVKGLFPEGAAKAPPPTATEDAPAVKGAKGRKPKSADEPYLPVIKDFQPGLYERGTREVQVAQQRLEKQIENAATPEEKSKLEAQQKQWEACSFHTTRRAAQLSGSSYGKILEETGDPTGQARPGFGAWHKRGVVLKNGGEDVWDKKTGKLEDAYSRMQVGDFVSIGNGGMNKAAERYPDLAFEEGARHSGIVIGKTEKGVPIVEHDVHGKVYREPIDDLSAAHMGYSALSVFRAEPFKNTRAIKAKADAVEAQQHARAGWTGADPFTSEVKLDNPKERAAANRYVAAYQDLREELGVQYGVTPEHLDKSFRDVMAIGVQESNFDNEIVRTTKSSTTAQLGDEAKQWLTGESRNPLHNVVRDTLRWGRDKLDTVSASEAKDNAAYNREHGLKPNVPAWQKEIEIAGLMKTQPALSYEDAAQQVNAQYGKSEQPYQPLALRSHGTFKVKEVPEKAEIALDGALNGEENYGLGMSRFFHSDRGNLIAGLATYEQNYAKAREAFPPSSIAKDLGWNADQLDDFYRQVAMLAHNAPSKAYNRDFVNFYIAPIVSGKANDPNPDRDRFGVDYNRQVGKFRQELWGS